MVGLLQGSSRRWVASLLAGAMGLLAADSLTGCGLIVGQDPREQAIVRIQRACEQLTRADIEAALNTIGQNGDGESPGTGNIAFLLDTIPELESVSQDSACLRAFLDALEPVNQAKRNRPITLRPTPERSS